MHNREFSPPQKIFPRRNRTFDRHSEPDRRICYRTGSVDRRQTASKPGSAEPPEEELLESMTKFVLEREIRN